MSHHTDVRTTKKGPIRQAGMNNSGKMSTKSTFGLVGKSVEIQIHSIAIRLV